MKQRLLIASVLFSLLLAACAPSQTPKVVVTYRGGMTVVCRVGQDWGAFIVPTSTTTSTNVASCTASYNLSGVQQVEVGGVKVACIGTFVPKYPWNCVPY